MSPTGQSQAQSLRSQTVNGPRRATSEPLVQKAGEPSLSATCTSAQLRRRPLLGSKATGPRLLHSDRHGTSQARHFYQRRQAPPSAGRRPRCYCDTRVFVPWKPPAVSRRSACALRSLWGLRRGGGGIGATAPGPQGTGERGRKRSRHKGSALCPTPLDPLSVLSLCSYAVYPF